MMIRLKCAECGAKLKVDESLAGRKGKCPACKTPFRIPQPEPESAPDVEPVADEPQAPSVADDLFEEDFFKAPTIEEKAAEAASASDTLSLDGMFDDDDPPPQIILPGGEKPGESKLGTAAAESAVREQQQGPVTQTGERIFDHGELPSALSKLNHYLICDHKEVVARWEYDGRGWMIHLKDGFTRAATVENQIPQFGNFILVEVAVERRDDGLHLQAINVYQLRRQYALTKIAKGDDAILETIIDYSTLNPRQYTHVKNLVKSKFLPHMWGEMEAILGPPPKPM